MDRSTLNLLLFLVFSIVWGIVLTRHFSSPPPRPHHVLLVVMVKDEEKVITRLLNSTRTIVTHLLVCDTGSEDGTKRLVKESGFDAKNMRIYDASPFVHFEYNRNVCGDEAYRLIKEEWPTIEWILLADADFELQVRNFDQQPPVYNVNTIQIHAADPRHPHNALQMLISAKTFAYCIYRLWTHEFIDCSRDKTASQGHYSGLYYIDHTDGKSRPSKLKRDIDLLSIWLQQQPNKQPELVARAWYYLARAYEDSNQTEKALAAYDEHEKVETYTNYRFYAAYRRALIKVDGDIPAAFLHAIQQYDGYFRAEPLYQLARFHRLHNNVPLCIVYASAAVNVPPMRHDRVPLFIENYVYEYAAREELAWCLLLQGDKYEAAKQFDIILANNVLPKDVRERVEQERIACSVTPK